VRAWNRFFFEPVSVSAAALVRICWGAMIALYGLTLLPDVDPFLTEGALRYDRPAPAWSWNALDWVDWDQAPLVVCLLLIVSGVLTALGAWTRPSTLLAVLCLVALQRTNTTILNSGDLLVRLIGLSLLLSPAGSALSVDEVRRRWRGDQTPPSPRAPYGMRLLQLMVAVGYSLSAWSKVQGETWNNGLAVGYALRIEDLQRVAPPGWLFAHDEVLNLLTWGSLGLEAAFVFLVWNLRLRPWVIGAGVAFHLGIDLFLDVGFFSWAVFVAYLAFLPPDTADRWLDALRRGLARLGVHRRAPAEAGSRAG
jgi:uncharacterized membrane protein YphA (DoxX/SURF4 family)